MSHSGPFVLTSKDFALIESLLLDANDVFSGLALAIRRKLLNATLVFPEDIEPSVVTMDSRVRYRVGGLVEERTLVAGTGSEADDGTCVLGSSRGLALLGASVGQSVQALRHDGSIEILLIEAVLYQPEAHRQTAAAVPPPAKVSSLATYRRRGSVAMQPTPDDDDPGPRAA